MYFLLEIRDQNTTCFTITILECKYLNGSGYINLVRIVDNLNDGEVEDFARFILKKALNDNKIKMLKEELLKNRNRYISILYL